MTKGTINAGVRQTTLESALKEEQFPDNEETAVDFEVAEEQSASRNARVGGTQSYIVVQDNSVGEVESAADCGGTEEHILSITEHVGIGSVNTGFTQCEVIQDGELESTLHLGTGGYRETVMTTLTETQNSDERPLVTLTFDNLTLANTTTCKRTGCRSCAVATVGPVEDLNVEKPTYRLQNVSGIVRSGEILAIMGSSGAGKSTLMDILSGTKRHNTSVFSGDLFVTKREGTYCNYHKKERCIIGYVTQESILMATQSVEETLWTHAQLRCPQEMSRMEKEVHIGRVMKQMGLTHIKNVRVGSQDRRGISGGEKKRLQIAVQLLQSPDILFLDEPTSGLDSQTAEKLLNTLRLVADQGVAIVCTIHQPRYSIFYKMDNLLLLTKGILMYFGPATNAVEYFSRQGYECPRNGNPADFIIDVTTLGGEVGKQQSFVPTMSEVELKSEMFYNSSYGQQLKSTISNSQQAPLAKLTPTLKRKIPTSTLNQVGVLLKRQMTHYSRTPGVVLARLIEAAVVGFLIGGIFWKVDLVQDLAGAIIFSFMWIAFTGFGQVSYMIKDRILANSEISSSLYSIGSYYVVQTLINTLVLLMYDLIFSIIVFNMVGLNGEAQGFGRFFAVLFLIHLATEANVLFASVVSTHSEEAFLISAVAVIVPILFSGFFRRINTMPVVLQWVEHLSFVKYAALVSLDSQVKHQDKLAAAVESFGYNETGLGLREMYLILASFAVFWRLMPYFALKMKFLIRGSI